MIILNEYFCNFFHNNVGCECRSTSPPNYSEFIWPFYDLIRESFPIKNGLYFSNFVYILDFFPEFFENFPNVYER